MGRASSSLCRKTIKLLLDLGIERWCRYIVVVNVYG